MWDKPRINFWKREESWTQDLETFWEWAKGGDGGGKVREMGGDQDKNESVKYFVKFMVV